MKKATLTVLLALCLALLLTACGGEETISGRITEYLRGDAGVNGFLMERDRRTVGVRLDEKSGIYPDLVIITEKALRDAEYPGSARSGKSSKKSRNLHRRKPGWKTP